MPTHLRPMAPVAPDVILCGDPGRALYVAELLIEGPKMSNHHRGLLAYHGLTGGGRELSVQATGIGGPSAAVVIGELAALGARRLVRVGTARAAGGGLPLGTPLAVHRALGRDGVSRALAGDGRLAPDPALAAALADRLGSAGTVLSRDLYPAGGERIEGGVDAWDLQTAAVLTCARRHALRAAAALLIVAEEGLRLEDDPLEAGIRGLALAAAGALAAEA